MATSLGSEPSLSENDKMSTPNQAQMSDDEGNQVSPLEPLGHVEPPFKPSRGFKFAFASICMVCLAAALDATSLSIALPIITNALHGLAIEAFWAGTSFLVTSAVFMPVIGGLSHVFGRKELILASSLFFFLGSLVSAVAKNFTTMLIGRSIQGIGGGGIMTLSEILVTDLVPLAVRGAWLGILGSMWAIGTVTGPLMGGAFAQNVSWVWIFWINLPMIGLGAVATFFFLRIQRLPGKIMTKVKYFDWIGSVFFVAATVSFMVPLTWGGVMFSWSSWRTLFPLLIGAAGLIGFGFYERWLSSRICDSDGNQLPGNHIDPIIRFTIFRNWTLLITYLGTMIHGMVLWSLLYYLPLYYEGVKGFTPIMSGVAVLPETTLVAPLSVVVGILAAKTGRYRWAIWSGWVLTCLGCGVLALLDVETTTAEWIFINIAVSAGTGILFPSMALGIQAAARQEDAGHSVAFFAFIRVFGQSLGVAVGGVAFQNSIRRELLSYPSLAPMALQYSQDATALVQIIHMMEEGTTKTELRQAYADGLKVIWYVMCALSGFALLASLFTKGFSLNQEHKSQQGYQHEKKVAVDPEKGRPSPGSLTPNEVESHTVANKETAS